MIETQGPAQYQVRDEPELNQIIIEVDEVRLPDQFKRPYIAKDFKQDVATINAYQGEGGSTARVVIQMKRPVQPTVQQEGNSILVMTSRNQLMMASSVRAMVPDDMAITVTQNENFSQPDGAATKLC